MLCGVVLRIVIKKCPDGCLGIINDNKCAINHYFFKMIQLSRFNNLMCVVTRYCEHHEYF